MVLCRTRLFVKFMAKYSHEPVKRRSIVSAANGEQTKCLQPAYSQKHPAAEPRCRLEIVVSVTGRIILACCQNGRLLGASYSLGESQALYFGTLKSRSALWAGFLFVSGPKNHTVRPQTVTHVTGRGSPVRIFVCATHSNMSSRNLRQQISGTQPAASGSYKLGPGSALRLAGMTM